MKHHKGLNPLKIP